MIPGDFVHVTNMAPPAPVSYFWRLFSTFYSRSSALFKAKVSVEEEARLNRFPETQEALRAIHQLLNTDGEFFTGTVVQHYLKTLWTEYPTHLHYSVDGVIYPPTFQKSPFDIAKEVHVYLQENPHITQVAIPYDVNQHHVVIYLDLKDRKVEYYDPLGKTPEETGCERKLDYALHDQVDAIKSLFFGDEGALHINKAAHQTCCFRCAIWGLLYIESRLRGKSIEEIESSSIAPDEIDRYRKEVMASKIHAYALTLLSEEEAKERDKQP
jgi:hypothetical protein